MNIVWCEKPRTRPKTPRDVDRSANQVSITMCIFFLHIHYEYKNLIYSCTLVYVTSGDICWVTHTLGTKKGRVISTLTMNTNEFAIFFHITRKRKNLPFQYIYVYRFFIMHVKENIIRLIRGTRTRRNFRVYTYSSL